MKARHWSLALVLFLINYLIFSSLFTQLVGSDYSQVYATRTPIPTFTPAPAQPGFAIPTLTPPPILPTPTATRVIPIGGASAGGNTLAQEPSPAEAAQPADEPQLTAPGSVNIRSGPGVNYTVIGTLNANTAMAVTGRNAEGSWWQIRITSDTTGWVAGSVVQASHTGQVPVVDAPPPPVQSSVAPQPAADARLPEPEKPEYQYEPTGWYDDGNAGLTRFMGDIVDVSGNPVNGVFVMAKCGDFSTVSFPSGPVGWGPLNEGADWPAGFYDIVVDEKPVPCVWTLTIVDTEDRQNIKAYLSESVPVQITSDKSIVTANWRKNW